MESEATSTDDASQTAEGQAVEGMNAETAENEQQLKESEGMTAEDEGEESEGESKEDESKPDTIGAPEGDYSTEGLDLPEGLDLDEGTIGALGNVCKDLNLSQKTFGQIVQKVAPVIAERQAAQIDTYRGKFLEMGRADPEIGGAKWKASLSEASKAYSKFVDPETQMLLEKTGLNCHPGLIKTFRKIYKLTSDDSVVRGRVTGQKRNPLADFYDKSNMN